MRLHISPLTPELLPTILGTTLLPLVANVSFHSITTFPEKAYGFLELPIMEAQKLKKKLNGTILRGQKMKVDEARRDKRKEAAVSDTEEVTSLSTKKIRKFERKRKREDGVLPGHELPKGRKVKRGWTEPVGVGKDVKSKKKKGVEKDGKSKKAKASSYTDKPELLFKTKVPDGPEAMTERRSKRKKHVNDVRQEVVVHEFEHTTKAPSFLRDNFATKGKKPVEKFDEERGWVDETGDVIEAPQKTSKRSKVVIKKEPSLEAPDMQGQARESNGADTMDMDDNTSSSENPSEDAGGSFKAKKVIPNLLPALEVTQSSPTEPHPLEKLFKKPKAPPTSDPSPSKPSLEVNTSFTFFNDDSDERVEKSMETPGLPTLKRGRASRLPNLSIPATPYTQRDMNWRSQRSAAPTPDTAAPGKGGFGDIFGKFHKDDDDIEEEDEDVEGQGEASNSSIGKKGEKEESEFAKWFWEKRGENNRAWKKRRREAVKEQRQMESKKRKKAL